MDSEQEKFWSGAAGDAYTARNQVTVDSALTFFMRALDGALDGTIKTAIELGANRGHNLAALKRLFGCETTAIEINGTAIATMLKEKRADNILQGNFLARGPMGRPYDLVLTKGVLIHIPPKDLAQAFQVIDALAGRYVLMAEYYSPRIEMIPYRGEDDRLWKAPHAELFLAAYSNYDLRDYGFISKLDMNPEDDLTWWLLEKRP